LPVENFITGPFTNDLNENEILLGVEVPKPGTKAKWGYWKFMRQVGEFAKASAVVYHDEDRQITRCAIGALGRQPLILQNSEKIFDGTLTPAGAIKESLPDRDFKEMRMHVTAIERALDMARKLK
jgi:carbon-monoxide dehydrogenase medium subunit